MLILSNNIWKCDDNHEAWKAKGDDCSAEVRSKGFAKVYTMLKPDLIGLQESSIKMNELLMDVLGHLPDAKYELITGGDTPIIYRSDRLKLMQSGFFRYTEEIEGLKGSFNNWGTKSYCYGIFEEYATGKRLAFMSTHLWFMSSDPSKGGHYQAGSDVARAYQINQACDCMEAEMAKYACPGIIVGDFNAGIESKCLDAVYNRRWCDVYDTVTGQRDETCGHHYCFADGWHRSEPGCFKQAIDHIIVKGAENCKLKDMLRFEEPWYDCLSDHYPLYVTFEFSAGENIRCCATAPIH